MRSSPYSCARQLRGFWAGAGHPGGVLGTGCAHPAGLPCGQCCCCTDPPQTGQTQKPQENGKNTILDLAPQQMLRTKQYWLCAGAVCFSTPAVLLFSPIILKLGMERGLDEQRCAVERGAGQCGQCGGPPADAHAQRPDRPPPHRHAAVWQCLLGLSAAFACSHRAGAWWPCYAGLTFCYSALAAVLPALSTDLFGLPHAGVNYGFLALGQSVGSLAFPFAANLCGAGQPGGTGWPWQQRGGGLCLHLGACGRSGQHRPKLGADSRA